MIDRRPGARRVLVPLLVALAIAAAAAGCRRRAVELDRDRVAAEVPRRLAASIRRPDVAVRLEGLVAAAVADPAVQAAGDALVARLQADPAVRAAFASFLATLDEHPRLDRDLAAIARDRPDATPDEIGDLAEQRMEAAMSRRSFHAAVGRAWGEVLASPHARPKIGRAHV